MNQDIQRAYEEDMLKEMTAALNRYSVGDNLRSKTQPGFNNPPGMSQ